MGSKLSTADCLFSIYDKETGRYLIVLKMLENVEMVSTIIKAYMAGDDLEQLGGAGFDMEKCIMFQADQAAALHARYWNDREFISKVNGYVMHAEWVHGEAEDRFNSARGSYQMVVESLKADPENLFSKNYPQALEIIEAGLAKTSWEDYKAHYMASDLELTLLHGDYHANQMMWDKSAQKGYLLDYEYMAIGPAVMDLAYFMVFAGKKVRNNFEEKFLARYHESLIASGKVDPVKNTLEKLKADYRKYFVSRAGYIAMAIVAFLPADDGARVSESFASFIEDYGVTKEEVLMPHFMNI